jgi:hypothetical protein
LDASRIRVLGETGTAYDQATSGLGKENITVLMVANAAGEKLPSLIVFKGKNVLDSWMAPPGKEYLQIIYAVTKNGWMETETFRNYFTRNFIQNIHPERPAALIYDGHSSHIDMELVEKARKENIVLLKLPPHMGHVLQPMDLGICRLLELK